MDIYHANECPAQIKNDGTVVIYHLFGEYEVHHNTIPPGAVQEWHCHDKIEETICVAMGVLEIRWFDSDEQIVQTLLAGDVARVKNSTHTLANQSQEPCIFVVTRLVLDGTDHTKLFQLDKRVGFQGKQIDH